MTSAKLSKPTPAAKPSGDGRRGCLLIAAGLIILLAGGACWLFLVVLSNSLGDAPPPAITFRNDTERTIGVTRATTALDAQGHLQSGPPILFVVSESERSQGWSSEQPDPLCEHPDIRYHIVEFDLPPERYVPGETPIERFTLLETIGPNICWDSKRPSFTYDGEPVDEVVALERDDLVATRWTVVRSQGGSAALPLGGSFQFVRGNADQSDGLILEIGCGNEATKTMTWHETGFSTSGYRTRLLGGEVCEGEFPSALSKLLDHDLIVGATLEEDLLVLRRDPLTLWARRVAG